MKNYKTEIRDRKLLMEFEKDSGVEISEKEAENKLLGVTPEEYDTPGDSELIYAVQDVVNKVYPHIVTNLGPSEYQEETPNVEVWNDIYARYSGIPEMRGEDSETTKAEWKAEDNTIYIYYPNMLNTEDIIRSLLHEYAHSLQDQSEKEENRKLGYDDDPSEIEAHQAEESWRDYLVYLKDNVSESQGDKEKVQEATSELLQDKLDDEQGHVESGDFTPSEISILNLITKKFSEQDLVTIATRDPSQFSNELIKRWGMLVKLFGETTEGDEDYGKSTRYAKWAIDNINGAKGVDFDDESIDFSRVSNPIKAWPSVYEVNGVEDGWEHTYRSGFINIVAYDAQDAHERAEAAWWEYDPDMETTDYGDYESEGFEIEDVNHGEILKESNIDITDPKTLSPDLEIGDRIMAWDLTPDPSPPGSYSSYPDGAVKIPRTLIGIVIDSLDDDEIDLESFRGGIKYLVRDDSSGEEYGLYGGWGQMRKNGELIRAEQRDKWVKLPPKNLNESKKILGKGMVSPRAFDTYCHKFNIEESEKNTLKTKLTEGGVTFTKNWWEHYNKTQIKA